jgi:hypothetical protein
MANPYYNTGAGQSDYTQGHGMSQPPYQQTHPGTAGTTAQHLYQHSPYAVHSLPPSTASHHPGYATTGDHGVLQYAQTIPTHPHDTRWVDTETDLLEKYHSHRADQPPPDYEIDQHQDHHAQHAQQQRLQSLQTTAVTPTQETQTHAGLQAGQPITSVASQSDSMSPSTRPNVIRTGASFYIFGRY